MCKNFFNNPAWVGSYNYPYKTQDEITHSVFDEINPWFNKVPSDSPLVSIVISALNEEADMLKTVSSLAAHKTQYPFRNIVVNKNSTVKTQVTPGKPNVANHFQPIPCWGPARQMGMENARVKYILMGVSDCIYPRPWLEKMITTLKKNGTLSVYEWYYFMSEKKFARWQPTILEKFKDLIGEVSHVKPPFSNSHKMSMGIIREVGMKEGFYMNKTDGEDGGMCYHFMKYGNVKQIRSYDSKVWTQVRTLKKSGTFSQYCLKE